MAITIAAAAVAAANHRRSDNSDIQLEPTAEFCVFEISKKSGFFSKAECMGYLCDFSDDGHPVCRSKDSPIQLLFYNRSKDSEFVFCDIWGHMRNLNVKYDVREIPIDVNEKLLDKKATLVYSRVGLTTYKQFNKWRDGDKFKYAPGHALLKRILECDDDGKRL